MATTIWMTRLECKTPSECSNNYVCYCAPWPVTDEAIELLAAEAVINGDSKTVALCDLAHDAYTGDEGCCNCYRKVTAMIRDARSRIDHE